MRVSFEWVGFAVVICAVAVAGCAKPGPVRTKPLQVTSQEEYDNPGMVADRINEEAKKMGAIKK